MEGCAVGRHLQESHPEIEISARSREIDLCPDWPGNFHVGWERFTVKHKVILTSCKGAIVVRAIAGVGVSERFGRVRTKSGTGVRFFRGGALESSGPVAGGLGSQVERF